MFLGPREERGELLRNQRHTYPPKTARLRYIEIRPDLLALIYRMFAVRLNGKLRLLYLGYFERLKYGSRFLCLKYISC